MKSQSNLSLFYGDPQTLHWASACRRLSVSPAERLVTSSDLKRPLSAASFASLLCSRFDLRRQNTRPGFYDFPGTWLMLNVEAVLIMVCLAATRVRRRSLLASATETTQWTYTCSEYLFKTLQSRYVLYKRQQISPGSCSLEQDGKSWEIWAIVLILSQASFVPTGQPSCAWCLLISCLFTGVVVAGWGQAQCWTFVQLDTTAL